MDMRSESFRSDAFQQKILHVRTLSSALPAEALAPLAEEVIARLAASMSVAAEARPSDESIDACCRALLSPDDAAAARFVLDLRDQGASIEAICLRHLSAAARRLGEWWERDEVTFMDVTQGVGRIYAILRGLRHASPEPAPLDHPSAVFASTPGETHTLGVRMAADLFRSRGWDVELVVGRPHDDVVEAVSRSPFRIFGVSAAGAHAAGALARLIVAVRIVRPDVHVLVSGPIVAKEPALLAALDADDLAADYDEAVFALDRIRRRGDAGLNG
jgi:methanogenic corrinoid protein MtbC1